jgi:NADH:flavin oxidoreductase / NADH oxidase family
MSDYVSGSIRPYVAVDGKRAFADLLYHRLLYAHGEDEAYFLEDAKALRPHTELPIILVGGLRRADTMAGIIESGVADFISMARPFIRQPDLASRLLSGQQEIADCVSCNMCLKYDGKAGLRCWRTPRSRLLQHAVRHRGIPALIEAAVSVSLGFIAPDCSQHFQKIILVLERDRT